MDDAVEIETNNEPSQNNSSGLSEIFPSPKDSSSNKLQLGSKRSASPDTDDSFHNFKAPKLTVKPQIISKIPPKKPKKSTKKRSTASKNVRESNQKLIESSFFKTASPKPTFACPVCFKGFSDSNLQVIHMKTCAVKHNISTKTLLEAAKLQERQAEERVAIGLPSGPCLQPKKKTSNIKKMIPEGSSDMHLALALSESLREHEERQKFDEAIALAAETDEKVLHMTSSQRKSTLQSFGFVSNKPVVLQPVEKVRRKKLTGPTVLQTRSQEVRERILSDKIAQVLIGTESITQQQIDEENQVNADFIPLNLHSGKLKQMQKKPDNIWTSSSVKKKNSQYYVIDLQPFIAPKTDSSEPNVSEEREIDEESAEVIKIKEEPAEVIKIVAEPIETLPEIMPESPKSPVDTEFSDCLALDWSKMINSKSCSDVLIFLKDSKRIYSHWVVLLARCSKMTKDFLPNDDSETLQRFKISWANISLAGATAFMEFVYCGRLLHPETLDNEEIVQEIRFLAEKYEYTGVVKYLDKKIIETSKNLLPEVEKCASQPSQHHEMPQESGEIIQISDDDENLSQSELIKKTISLNESIMSPDIFSDMDSIPGTPVDSEVPEANEFEKKSDVVTTSPDKSENICGLIENKKSEKLIETPKRTIRRSLTCPDVLTGKKSTGIVARNDLSLFIAKVQRRNARDPFDSDTEEDSPLNIKRKLGINPFLVGRNLEESSLSIRPKGKAAIKKSALSIFEDEIRAQLKKSEIIEEHDQANNSDKVEAIENLSEDGNNESTGELNKNLSNISSSIASDVDVDMKNESMYTNYKKTHRYNNSIADYREILTNFKSQTPKKVEGISNNHEISAINKLRLAELSAFDDSMAPNRSSEISEEDIFASQNSVDLSQRLSHQNSIDLTQDSAPETEKMKIKSSPEQENESAQILERNSSVDLYWKWRTGDYYFPLSQKARSTSPEMSPKANQEDEIPEVLSDFILTDEEEAAEPCPVLKKSSSILVEGVTDILHDCGLLNVSHSKESCENNQVIIANSSPIHISSDSEAGSTKEMKSPFPTYEDHFAMNFEGFDDFITEGEMKTPPKSFWDDVQRPSTCRKSLNFDNVTYRSRKPAKKLEKNSSNIVTTISSDSDDDFPSFNLARMSSQPEIRAPCKKSDSLLLKTKSKSDSDFSICKQVDKSSKISKTSKLKIFNYLNLSPSEAEISLSIIPKEDYNSLSPTKLNDRLAIYGLRAQKPHRAVELLNYIYNQRFPEIPINILSQNEISDDELSEKAGEHEDSDNLPPIEENLESDPESAENLELSEEEYDDDEVLNIAKLFNKLLKEDRELYNQVLMYKPVSLENLHDKLKVYGVKSGPKVLADYLDDEGISFYIEFPKRKRKNKK